MSYKNIRISLIDKHNTNFEILLSSEEKTHFINYIKEYFGEIEFLPSIKEPAAIEKIILQSQEYFRIEDIKKRLRKREIIKARYFTMYYLNKERRVDLNRVSMALKYKHHSSVIHGINSIQDDFDTNPDFYNEYLAFTNHLKNLK